MELFTQDSTLFILLITLGRLLLSLVMLGVGLAALILLPQHLHALHQKKLLAQIKPDALIVTRDRQRGRVCQMVDNLIILQLEDGRKIEISLDAVERVEHE